MFFFIGGIQPKTVIVDRQPRLCPSCGQTGAYIKRADHYLSLFFIPLFPVKRGTPFMACENCNTVFDERWRGANLEYPKKQACTYCGSTVEPKFKYCPYCGKKL